MTALDPVIAAALASGASHARAGEAAGCSPATVKRRLAVPAFRAHVEEMRSNHVSRVAQRLGELSGRAIDALEALLADSDAPAQRLGASRAVIDSLLKYREVGEVERRLTALEARLGATRH